MNLLAFTPFGSCVTVCLYDAGLECGGVNHFMLPGGEGDVRSARYADAAITMLIDEMITRGCQRHHLVAKIFGGAAQNTGHEHFNVGQQNHTAAAAILQRETIPVVARDVGGAHGRKLVFVTNTGEALIKYLSAVK